MNNPSYDQAMRTEIIRLLRAAKITINNQWEGATGYISEGEAARLADAIAALQPSSAGMATLLGDLLDECISVEVCTVEEGTKQHTRRWLSKEEIAVLANAVNRWPSDVAQPSAGAAASYIDDLERHGTIDHDIAFEIKKRLPDAVQIREAFLRALPSDPTFKGAVEAFETAMVLMAPSDAASTPSSRTNMSGTDLLPMDEVRTIDDPTIDSVPSCGQENDYRRAIPAKKDDPWEREMKAARAYIAAHSKSNP